MQNVIAFPAKKTRAELAQIAQGRGRTEALAVIITRLKELRKNAVPGPVIEMFICADGTTLDTRIESVRTDTLCVEFIQNQSGVYFSISEGGCGHRVMTGYFDYRGLANVRIMARTGAVVTAKSKYPPGIHVMSPGNAGRGRPSYFNRVNHEQHAIA
jgi:hypothetical protein